MESNNEWMNDPELKNIDRAKLDFLNQMFTEHLDQQHWKSGRTSEKNDGIPALT